MVGTPKPLPPRGGVKVASLGYAAVLSPEHFLKPARMFNPEVREVGAGLAPQRLNVNASA